MALNNTSKIVGLPDIAQLIEDDLNLLSSTLFAANEIDTEIVFNITADSQEYSVMTTTANTNGDDIYYTPGILEKIQFNISSNRNMSSYKEGYSLKLYGYFDEMEHVRIIYDKYIMEQKGAYMTYNSWLITKSVQGIDFAAPIDPDDGTGKDRFLSIATMLYSFLDGGIHHSNTTLLIDGVQMPYKSLDIDREKQVKGGPYSTSDTMEARPNTQTLSIGIAFDLLSSNTKMVELAKDSTEENFMKNTYTIIYNDGVIDLNYDIYLSNGKYHLNEDGIATLTCTFNKHRSGGI